MNTMMPVSRMIDAALNNNFGTCRTPDNGWAQSPRADILEGEKDFRILMDLPGVSADKLDISLENQTLTVKAEREISVPEGFETRRRERSGQATFTRNFSLGTAVAQDGINAKLDDGILQITLPKSEQSLPRKIDVK